jgi:hypothetical protein
MENSMKAPQKTENRTTIDIPIPVLGIYLKECRLHYNKDTCMPMFTASLLTS